jgi:hypothetical protein
VEPLSNAQIEAELKTLTQKHVLLTSLVGLLVGLLQKEGVSDDLMSKLMSKVERLKPLSPTVSSSEWDALLKLVSSFSKMTD